MVEYYTSLLLPIKLVQSILSDYHASFSLSFVIQRFAAARETRSATSWLGAFWEKLMV